MSLAGAAGQAGFAVSLPSRGFAANFDDGFFFETPTGFELIAADARTTPAGR